ncbi:VWA domain-containing protein [Curvivirga sp.]|uniref:VWA domain-containing protein n=1 Tax=Curvivirga sp. TaxID=2856848 RepID=UPI003B5A6689
MSMRLKFKEFILILPVFLGIHFLTSTFAYGEEDRNKCEKTDIVFAIDTTYSLSSTIYDIKVELEDILDRLDYLSDGKLRLGLITFKDEIYIQEDLNDFPNLRQKKESIFEKIYEIRAEGGGGGPEASDETLNTILNSLPAQNRSQDSDFTGKFEADTKIIILITDNLPGGFDDQFKQGIDDKNAASHALLAAEQGVLISAIYTPTSYFSNDEITENIMRDYALITGGLYIKISSSGQGAAQAIMDIINACGRRPMV